VPATPKTYREKEHDSQKGKRRYRERLVEEEEAEKEIDLFKKRPIKDFDNYNIEDHPE